MLRSLLKVALFIFLSLSTCCAEPAFERGAVLVRNELRLASNGLRALAVAAHPDDEDGATLAYLRELGVETHICFCTRGEGGQNEAGPELGAKLAAVRTREIEEACAILGAKPWFINRPDFGFSKSVEETMEKWHHDDALERLVHVIRRVRPHLVITHHNPDGTDHAHHRSAGKLLVEAFEAAADAQKFPQHILDEQLQPWRIERIYLRQFAAPAATLTVDVSKRDALSGLSASEIGALSLSRHYSQGMLRHLKTGERELRYFSLLKARDPGAALKSLLDGLKPEELGIEEAGKLAEIFSPNMLNEGALTQRLLNYLGNAKISSAARAHISRALAEVLGLKFEASSSEAFICEGEKTKIVLRAANTGTMALTWESVKFQSNSLRWKAPAKEPAKQIDPGGSHELEIEIGAEAGAPVDYPPEAFQFLQEEARTPLVAQAEFTIRQDDKAFALSVEAPVPLHLSVPFSFSFASPQILFGNSGAGKTDPVDVKIKLAVICNRQIKEPLLLAAKAGAKPEAGDDGAHLTFNRKGASDICTLRAETLTVEQFAKGPVEIPIQIWDSKTFYPAPAFVAQRAAMEMPANMRVALVKGVDDQTWLGLKTLQDAGVGEATFSAVQLGDDELRSVDLNKFQAVILDIRATQQRPVVREIKERLKNFMELGGTVVCFYQKDFDWNEAGAGRGTGFFRGVAGGGEIAPYKIELSFDRVTREDAAVRILNAEHPLLLKPCRIWPRDFEGWIQERGAYFPKTWAPEYSALLSSNDPGEKPLDGGLLVADVGRGAFIYCSYFLHRQLNANNPGAYRLLANFISCARMKR